MLLEYDYGLSKYVPAQFAPEAAHTPICCMAPNEAEVQTLAEKASIPVELIHAVLDKEEPSRLQHEENLIVAICNCPIQKNSGRYDTLPISIIITPRYFISLCAEYLPYLEQIHFQQSTPMEAKALALFEIFLTVAQQYLAATRQMTKKISATEQSLLASTNNRLIFDLLQLQKSLVYFTTAIKDNLAVALKLRQITHAEKKHPLIETDSQAVLDLIKTVVIENRQAQAMVEIQERILYNMMGGFTSLISNNLSTVMKHLTSVTILMTVPMVLSSFWGMNVHVPWLSTTAGFYMVVAISGVLTVLIAWMLWKRDML